MDMNMIPMKRHLYLLFLLLSFSLAQGSLELVHTEVVQAGPYEITVGFSRWPVQAERSLDVVFMANGGIEEKTGTLTLVTATSHKLSRQKSTNQPFRLERHPRMREAWGLDVFAFPSDGQWEFKFAVDGAQGHGEGSLAVVLLERPAFLPRPVTSLIAFLPVMILLVIIVIAWQRDKPNLQVDTWSWK
jgi:hypothetical protein